ncbi:M48 family metalloprotease [bacterium]|nr:M48 family metalloprotease [bacterium]
MLTQYYVDVLTFLSFFVVNPIGCGYVFFLQSLAGLLLLVFAIRLWAHCHSMKKLLRHSIKADALLQNMLQAVATALKFKINPDLRIISHEMPVFTAGLLKPIIFLTPLVIKNLNEQELRQVLAHELVHVKRRDNLRKFLQKAMAMTFLTWIAYAISLAIFYRALDERFDFAGLMLAILLAQIMILIFNRYVEPAFVLFYEQMCDDAVSKVFKQPLELASALIKVWNLSYGNEMATPVLASSATASLEKRLHRLIHHGKGNNFIRYRRIVVGMIIVAVGLWIVKFHSENQLEWSSGHGKRTHLCYSGCSD